MLNGLDLFSGIGGISLALEPWVRTIAYCEQDRYAQGVLMSRMRDGTLDRAPIWDDVRTLRAEHFGTKPDIIFGGFPCQDISSAGRGAGLGGERSGLFFEIIRLVNDIRPGLVFLENVPAITTRGLRLVTEEFSALRYDCRWTVVSAAELGAPHLRKRWFMLAADPDSLKLWSESRRSGWAQRSNSSLAPINGPKESLADSHGFRKSQCAEAGDQPRHGAFHGSKIVADSEDNGSRRRFAQSGASETGRDGDWWLTEPDVGRVADGIPARMDRLRCLGNAVVPMQAREAFSRLIGIVPV